MGEGEEGGRYMYISTNWYCISVEGGKLVRGAQIHLRYDVQHDVVHQYRGSKSSEAKVQELVGQVTPTSFPTGPPLELLT